MLTRYKRRKPLTPEERVIAGVLDTRRLRRARVYNWRRILRVATENPGVWIQFDSTGRRHTVSVVNQRQNNQMRSQYPDWDFRCKATDGRDLIGGRKVWNLWIMAVERAPSGKQ